MKWNYRLLVYKSKKSKAKRRSVRLEKIIQNRAIKRSTKQHITKEIADELLFQHNEGVGL